MPDLVGLSDDEVVARRLRDGPNRLPAPQRPTITRRFAGQLVHFFAVMLWVAAALASIAGLAELAVAIAAVVVLNAVFTTVQEGRADRAAERLARLVPRCVRVQRRSGVMELDAEELVMGDVVLVTAGDQLAADARLVESRALEVDLSLMTGESLPVSPDLGAVLPTGCMAVAGEGVLEVVAVGAGTQLASMARLASSARRPTSPLAHELRSVVRTISLVAVGVGGLFLAVSIAMGRPFSDGAVLAIGVTVALVPEGLLPTVTLSLALGAERMSHEGALVRHLDAVETLGSTTFICSDKTGTLTQNRLEVAGVWTAGGLDEATLAAWVWRCVGTSDASLNCAVENWARGLGVDIAHEQAADEELDRQPFDPQVRRSSMTLASGAVAVGAPEPMMTPQVPSEVRRVVDEWTAQGRRVLAVTHDPATRGAEVVVGVIAFEDPPRPAVAEALSACRATGVKVGMITGDHPRTAQAIAERIGLVGRDRGRVITASELPEDLDELAAVVDVDGLVIARAVPADKVRVTQALQRCGHVVAMTGDGVNDAAALRLADVGIAMGASGTDAAREAADLVLLDDDFATITKAVRLGRVTFSNIRRFLTYHLTDNVAELAPLVLWTVSGGGIPLALTVMQILALDLGTDTLSAVALGAEPARGATSESDALGPASGRLLNRRVAWRAFAVLGPTEAVMEMLAFVAAGGMSDEHLWQARGAVFVAVVAMQTVNSWACRSDRESPWQMGWGGNRLLVAAVTVEVIIAMACLLITPVADALSHAVPPAHVWPLVGAGAVALLVVDRLDKQRLQHGR